MARYRRSTRVEAPLDTVWAFHSTTEGLEALTPGWLHLRVTGVEGPDGEPGPAVLAADSSVDVEIRPFGIGPTVTWTSRITHRERSGDTASFRDVMVDGPVPSWTHTHHFRADGEATIVTDAVEFELPEPLQPLSGVAGVGLAPMFAYRHRRTRSLLADRG